MSKFRAGVRPNLKLLIVEDDKSYRILAAESLQSLGNYNVTRLTADTGKAGLTSFRQDKPDITFLDIQLPDGNGLDLLEACLQCNPAAFIVMMTSSADAKDVSRAKSLGARGYILKPFNMSKMLDVALAYEIHCEKIARIKNHLPEEDTDENFDALFETQEQKQQEPTIQDIISDWNILFVDDYITNCDNAKRSLAKFKCKVETTTNGKEALEKMKKTSFHLMFLDTSMPDMDGYRIAMKIREKDRNEPMKSYLIGMIEDPGEAQARRWLQAGMNDFIIKPCSFSALEKILKKFANQYKKDLNETFLM